MNRQLRYKLGKMNRQLIAKYINDHDQKEYLRYLIDTIYDDTVNACNECNYGLVLEHINGDYAYGKCDNCNKKYHY